MIGRDAAGMISEDTRKRAREILESDPRMEERTNQIRRPGRPAWSGSELRQVHLAIVIRMWEVNLLEHRLTLR